MLNKKISSPSFSGDPQALIERFCTTPSGATFKLYQSRKERSFRKSPSSCSTAIVITKPGSVRINGRERQVETGDILLVPESSLKQGAPLVDGWVWVGLAWIFLTGIHLFF